MVDLIERKRPSIRQLVERLDEARGIRMMAGPPEKIAKNTQTWFEPGAADEFNVMPPFPI
ncbi:hypothetical protein [Bradyrhizobium cosmicum]|uniref:hypothetical protein n=1 Tax=Bradyrhizobium cosmicum TaxID=1404864 RepID=UPI0028EAA3EF|nr:hypothetical protein [Bradyrhizobium cosmicum]